MKLVKPSVTLIKQDAGLIGMYKHIEKIGRVCYKSEDKITEDSYKSFVDRMIASQHYAMLEHGTVHLKSKPSETTDQLYEVMDSPYSKYVYDKDSKKYCITTNYRVLVEHDALNLLNEYLCEPIESHPKRITLKFNTNIGVSREGNRSRSFSIAEQSTRYCNYTKDKFRGNIHFLEPQWDYTSEESIKSCFLGTLSSIETAYQRLIELGWKPQQAREILPLATATEVVYTAFESDWKHFFDLRLRETTGPVHPNMKEIALLAWEEINARLNLCL